MKKLISFIFCIFLSSPVFAGVITVQSFTADSSATHLDNFRSVVVTEFNGNIEGSTNGTSVANIKADSVYEINMADDANPRVRDSELFNITTDSQSGGTLTQGALVEDGLVPADSANLTSDISAGTAYINGFRVDKSATSQTYVASRDGYLDLSQTGVFTLSSVTNGAAAPAVAANSVRLAKVVTDGTEITSVTTLYTSRVPGLIIPSNYRDGLFVSRDSSTTVTVLPGGAEINNAMVNKTAITSLSVATAGDWAGGSSLRAADTFGFVGVDTSGNIKLHTTAPTHDNYGVSTTVGKRRYATWSGTVYRVVGWFYMDGASNALVEVASNLKEGNVPNRVMSQDPTTAGVVTNFTTTSATNVDLMKVRFYASGNPVAIRLNTHASNSSVAQVTVGLSQDLTTTSLYAERIARDYSGTAAIGSAVSTEYYYTPPQAARTYRAVVRTDTGTATVGGRTLVVEES